MNTITIILNLLPALIAAMKAIEEAVPGQGQGEAKLTAIRQILEGLDTGIVKLWPQISTTIGVLVTLFNASGVFRQK